MPREHEDYRAYLELIKNKTDKEILGCKDIVYITGMSKSFVSRHILKDVTYIGSCTLARMLCRGFK